MTVLETEKRVALEKELEENFVKKPKAEADLKALTESLNRARSLKEAVGKEQLHQETLKKLAESRHELKPDLTLLERHKLTRPFQEAVGRLRQLERNLKTNEAASKEAAETHAVVTEQARLCLSALKAQLANDKLNLAGQQKETETKLTAMDGDIQSLKAWLDEHKGDAGLPPILPTVSSELADLKHARSSLVNEWSQLRKRVLPMGDEAMLPIPQSPLALDLSAMEEIFDDVRSVHNSQIKKAKRVAEAAEREARIAAFNLENARKVASMEDVRAELKNGDPCPLCGSEHHPYNEGVPPTFPFKELEETLETAQKSAKAASKAYESLENLTSVLNEHTASLPPTLEALHGKVASLRDTLRPLGVPFPEQGEEDALASDLRKRAEAYAQKLKKRETTAHQRTLLKQSHETLVKNLETTSQKHSKAERIELPDLEPGISTASLEAASTDLPKETRELESHWEDLKDKLSKREEGLRHVRKSLESSRRDWTRTHEQLTSNLKASAFDDVDDLKAAHLDKDKVDQIEKRKADLDQRETAAKTRLDEVRKTITVLREHKAPEGEAADALEQNQKACSEALSVLLKEIGRLDGQLKQDDENRRKRKAAEEKIKTDLENLRVWEQLRGLIGSSDGNLFRKFAQGLSLQLLIHYANRQMSRLNDRYQLQRSKGDNLKIEILDQHQAGAVRPMESLSGGETFLASLALALGLSVMAGRNVQIDSLFIDEGFGSLDSDALDLAISALEALRSQNKNIGVISHVDLLKERIAAQICVEKLPGGISYAEVRG